MGRKLPSFQDYLENSEITSVVYITFAAIIPGFESLTQETIDWIRTMPKLAKPTSRIGRYYDDIGSHEVSFVLISFNFLFLFIYSVVLICAFEA